jgi:hypothetical protein
MHINIRVRCSVYCKVPPQAACCYVRLLSVLVYSTGRLQHVTRPQAVTHSLQLCTPPDRYTASSAVQMSSQQYYSSDTVCARMYLLYIAAKQPYNRAVACHTIGTNKPTAVFSIVPCAVESEAFVIESVLACNVWKPWKVLKHVEQHALTVDSTGRITSSA